MPAAYARAAPRPGYSSSPPIATAKNSSISSAETTACRRLLFPSRRGQAAVNVDPNPAMDYASRRRASRTNFTWKGFKMKRSSGRILTTFVGSLARPADLIETMTAREGGGPYDSQTGGAHV